MANVKYIGNDTKKSEKGKIHTRNENYTACGARIDDNPQDWETTAQSVTCEKKVVSSLSYFLEQ
jgi:hypothetical protein